MKKDKLAKFKKLTKKELKDVAGGQGRCTPGTWTYEYITYNEDGTHVDTNGGDDGAYVLVYHPGVC
ncbi:ComC/BlpC family leader-containing pheromone/bacteriocin [uncultured Chryseobacterium sp.]|uniref:ComC/BlpC family leader-containing pheromone/bacteriocin n=1 Tax=uncultured Chryseobacterium sp. TaxID=259322 RepID=UPI0025CCECF4|nr:ComC/BlpC family leader-containing pheromone/bacteriocin [uncultured Chryseobacterium sp.]